MDKPICFMETINEAYVSDKYQYTMGKSYLDCGKQDQIAVFNLFYRKAPENNNWAVVSGTEEVIEMVLKLGSEPESFYERFLPGEEYKEFRKYLSTMKFTGDRLPEPAGRDGGRPAGRGPGPGDSDALYPEPPDGGRDEGVPRLPRHRPAGLRIRLAPGPWPLGGGVRWQGGPDCRLRQLLEHPDRCLQRRPFDRHDGP